MKLNRDNSKSLDAARASSSLSNSQCSKEPRAARAECKHISISLSQFIQPEASVIEPEPELKCKRQTKDVNIRDFLFFFRLPSVRSQRMFYQFAHNKCLDYSQADQRAEARVFPVVVRLPFTSRKRMFHQFSQRQLSILKTSFYLIQIFLLLHQLTPQSQGQSSCQICCDYYTGDYGKASKQCNEVFKM